jgi:hypothetical protein
MLGHGDIPPMHVNYILTRFSCVGPLYLGR